MVSAKALSTLEGSAFGAFEERKRDDVRCGVEIALATC